MYQRLSWHCKLGKLNVSGSFMYSSMISCKNNLSADILSVTFTEETGRGVFANDIAASKGPGLVHLKTLAIMQLVPSLGQMLYRCQVEDSALCEEVEYCSCDEASMTV